MDNLKVLIAEYDHKILYAFNKVLESEGWDCIGTANVLEALEKIPQGKPHAVFLDISMSEVEYEQIFEKIAARHLQMPLVIITSHITEKLKSLADSVGALQVIEKPLKVENVRNCLDRIKTKLINR